MSKTAEAVALMPPVVLTALKRLGENLALARVRRKEPQRLWAKRLGVSVPTLIRMEHGDARVSMGVYATALWMMGRVQALPELADPQTDRGALELDVSAAQKRRRIRTSASKAAALSRTRARDE